MLAYTDLYAHLDDGGNGIKGDEDDEDGSGGDRGCFTRSCYACHKPASIFRQDELNNSCCQGKARQISLASGQQADCCSGRQTSARICHMPQHIGPIITKARPNALQPIESHRSCSCSHVVCMPCDVPADFWKDCMASASNQIQSNLFNAMLSVPSQKCWCIHVLLYRGAAL